MQQDIETAAAVIAVAIAPRTVSAAEYDHAERFIARIRQAVTDPAYRTALLAACREIGWGHLIPNLVRAIDAYRVDDAGELVLA